ncbi:hypothetical protein [Cysteiniphilum halobium]|uniref:hypothetical protein n=1 Tax=Cysteiniphilum halobium TaxID=2219059 RepID=UPI003F82BB0B
MKIKASISILIGLGITSQAFAGWGEGWNVEMTNLTTRDMQVYPYNCMANSKAKNDTITVKLKNGEAKICSKGAKEKSDCIVPPGGVINGYCAASFWHQATLSMGFRNPDWSHWKTITEFRVPKVGTTALWFSSLGNTPDTYRFDNAYVSWWATVQNKTKAGQNEGIWSKKYHADKGQHNISGYRYSAIEGLYEGVEAYASRYIPGFPSFSLPFAVAWTENKEGGSKNNFFIAEFGDYNVERVKDKAYKK